MDRKSNLRVPPGAKARVLCSLNGTAEAVPYPKPIAAEAVPHPEPTAGEAVPYRKPITGEAVLCQKSIDEMASQHSVLE